jgi:2-polyprenyl-3-methyl-5-hydroxy-6-metoxy-1,4-benzoquinol methylase
MEIQHKELTDAARYIETHRHITLQDHEADYQNYLRMIRKCKEIDSKSKLLEIGVGTGWFPIACAKHGISCKGLEISPQLIEYAKEFGRACGVEPDIELGNIEETDLGIAQFDVILGQSVFEHIEHWRKALKKVYDALKPGGVFAFSSTNKFSFHSDEYSFPLYGWLPDQWRYRLRVARQGPDIMKLGIDFNQFTYPQLRRAFREAGFSRIYDRVEFADPAEVANPAKRRILQLSKSVSPIKHVVLCFADATMFLCVK